MEKPYQKDYILSPVANQKLLQVDERERKARKVVSVLRDFSDISPQSKLLDMSCSTGLMANIFSEYYSDIVGIDIDEVAIETASKLDSHSNVHYLITDAMQTCFPDNSFDAVICNQMYEHVPSASRLIDEIYRVLRVGGVCYFGATNKLKIIETHYGNIPFLSYLPKSIADKVVRKLRRGKEYYETLYTEKGLRKLVERFTVIDYTQKIISQPIRYHAENLIRSGSVKQKLALFIAHYAYPLLPGYVWLLVKE